MLAFLSLFLAPLVAAYPNRGACTGDCWTKDPAVIQRNSDGKYFRFGTGTGIPIITSNSIKGPWSEVGKALPDGSKITVEGVDSSNIWAPDVHFSGGTYYMYYVLSKLGTQTSQIGVATSKTLAPGSWTDHGSVGIPANSAYNRIDPNWINIDGKQYLNFGSFWGDIYQVELESPLKVGSNTPHQISYNETLNHREEGSFMYQHGSYYYLFFSSGIAGGYTKTSPPEGAEYHISVCRSSGGSGGFVDKSGKDCLKTGGTVVLASHGQVYGPGGQGIINDKDLGPVLYYHYYPLATKQAGGSADGNNANYKFSWNQLTFTDGWPVVSA